ncbi:MAG: alpha/beta fold hydrolase [Phycicoccus sp.]
MTRPADQIRESRKLDQAPVPSLTWRACEAKSEFECATATVPLDYDEPRGETTELGLIRLPATGPREGVRSLFHNSGGPGGSAVESVRAGFGKDLSADVRERFDIVGVDPRGVGGSGAIDCFAGDTKAREAFLSGSVAFPLDRAEERLAATRSRELARRCHAADPRLLPHLSTANVARDFELLRRATGDDELSFYGWSYGTFLGQTYAALFPDRVGAFVLDGNVEPGPWVNGRGVPWLRNGTHTGSEAVVEAFFEACDTAGPQRCPLTSTTAPAEERMTTLLDRLEDGPIVVEDQGNQAVLRYDQALEVLVGLATSITANWQPAGQFLDRFIELVDAAPDTSPRPEDEVIRFQPPALNDAQLAITCVDNDFARDPRQWPGVARRASAEAPHAGARTAYFVNNQACASWAVRDEDRYTGPWKTKTATPVLLLNNTLDGATPVENAEAVNGLLRGSVLLRVDAVGHLSTNGGTAPSQCAADAVNRYLLDGVLPVTGTVCRSEQPEPFSAPATTSAPRQRVDAAGQLVARR